MRHAKPSLAGQARTNRDLLRNMGKVAGRFREWRPQEEVLLDVEAVPTCFPAYDVANGIGGHPVSRIVLVHGPSNEGKTAFELGLLASFLARGHFAGLGDAERTTPAKWVTTMLGGLAKSPGFVALPIRTYEQVRDAVRSMCEGVAEARVKREIPETTSAIIAIDSIRKLVPKKLFDELAKAEKADGEEKKAKGRFAKKPKGVDGYGGRAAQLKAALNAAWMDELVPLLADTRTSMLLIARETKLDDANPWGEAKRDWKIGGGTALYYEASLAVRVTREFIHVEKRLVGERHDLEIHKTKVAGKQEEAPTAFFHVSNGAIAPEGFDRARDVVALAIRTGALIIRGSWIADGRPVWRWRRARRARSRSCASTRCWRRSWSGGAAQWG